MGDREEFLDLQAYPSLDKSVETRLAEIYARAQQHPSGLDVDSLLVGGPYNGNSLNIPDAVTAYRISARGGQTWHVYKRTGFREFTYSQTEHSAVPQIEDSNNGVQSSKSSTGGFSVEA